MTDRWRQEMAWIEQQWERGSERKRIGMSKKSAANEKQLEADGWTRTRWIVGWREASGKRVYKSLKTKKEAESYSAKLRTEIDDGTYTPKAERLVPLGEYMERKVSADRNLRVATKKSYQATLGHLTKAGLAARPIGSITTKELQDFYAEWTAGAHTLETIHKHLAATFNAAVTAGDIARSPLKTIRNPKAAAVKPIDVGDLPTLNEVLAIADHTRPQYRAAIFVAAFAGLRGGEVGGLRVKDLIDLDGVDPQIWVRQAVSLNGLGELKTKGSRAKVHIGRVVADELRRHIEAFPPADDGRIFYTNGHKGVLDSTRFNRVVKDAAEAAGVSGVRAHLLRHTCASLLIQAGKNPKQVQQHMRHTKIEMTFDTYADLWPSDLQEIGTTFDRLIEAGTPKALTAAS